MNPLELSLKLSSFSTRTIMVTTTSVSVAMMTNNEWIQQTNRILRIQ